MFKKEKKILEDSVISLISVLGSKKEIIRRNFIAGVSRGVGIGVGFTIISSIIIIILRRVVMLNIPVIGEYIKDIVEIVQKNL